MHFIFNHQINFILLLTVLTHSVAGIILTQGPTKLVAPLMRVPPLENEREPNPAGIFPTRSPMLARSVDEIVPHSEMATRAPAYGSLSISLRAVETLHCWHYPPLRVPTLMLGFSSLRASNVCMFR